MDGAGHDRSSETSSANRDASGFMAVSPCLSEAEYVRDTATITFGFNGAAQGFSYDPKCLRIQAGQTVTFSGSFAAHPLYPSAARGSVRENPISGTGSGTSRGFQFPSAGYYAYYCGVHGATDDGSAMAGVVWVE